MLKSLLTALARWLIALPAAPVLALAALLARPATLRRQRAGHKPRLVYGPAPIISIQYMSRALRREGYTAQSVVYELSPIHSRQDYDYLRDEFLAFLRPVPRVRRALLAWGGRYLVFVWLLARFDIFHFFFDGGFLARTPLRFLEVQLLHLAGKKVVVMPYGGDVAVPTRIRSLFWRHGLMRNYPIVGRTERQIRRQIDYFSRRADWIVACIFHLETLPRWDLLTTLYYPIDTDAWAPAGTPSPYDGKNGPVSVVHAPNHRGMKGTEQLIAACRDLQAEGYQVDLRLLERLPNAEVHRIMAESDILAEQFLQGYALTAMEGMSLGKVVMSNLSDPYYYDIHRVYTGLDECPIVNTPITEIKDKLRLLITRPDLRRQLGEAGRRYVLRYHSYAACAAMWEQVYRIIWHGEVIDFSSWHPAEARAPEPAPVRAQVGRSP